MRSSKRCERTRREPDVPIHYLSYEHWEGKPEKRLFRWAPMVPYHLRLFLKKKLIWLLLFLSFGPTIGVSIAIYVASPEGPVGENLEMLFEMVDVGGQIDPRLGRAEELLNKNMPLADRYLAAARQGFSLFLIYFQSFFVLITCSIVGSGLIARDMRSNALEIYLTKPLTRVDYVLGKLTVIAAFVFLVTFVPSFIIFMVATALLPDFFAAAWPVLPPLLTACLFGSCVNGIVILGLSSLAKSSRFAAAIWFALCFITWIVGAFLAAVTETPEFHLISYRNNFQYVFDALLGVDTHSWESAQHQMPLGYPLVVLCGYVVASIAILRSTIQGRDYAG